MTVIRVSRALLSRRSMEKVRRLTLQYAHGVGMENEVLLKVCGLCSPSSPVEINAIGSSVGSASQGLRIGAYHSMPRI